MRAVRLHAQRRPQRFTYENAPQPDPGSGEVLIAVHAAAVTPTELDWLPTWTTRTGEPRRLPIIAGHEFSGVVRKLGPGATGVGEGDPVFGMNDWYGDGAQAEYCVAPVAAIARKPRSVDDVAAATVPISALTAWQGLFDRGHLVSGQRVLVHGAAGGVGLFAVQLARWRSAHVIGTASAGNAELVRSLGADEVIDYRAHRFEDSVRNVDVVFDTVGGETLARSWDVLRPRGRMVTVAASAEQTSEPRVRDAFFIVEPSRSQLEEVAHLIDGGVLRTVVGAVFPLAQAEQAYAHKAAHGKVVLQVAG